MLGSVLSTSRGVPLILTTTLTGKHITVPIMRTQRPRSLKGVAHGVITSKWWGSNESLRKGDVAGSPQQGTCSGDITAAEMVSARLGNKPLRGERARDKSEVTRVLRLNSLGKSITITVVSSPDNVSIVKKIHCF